MMTMMELCSIWDAGNYLDWGILLSPAKSLGNPKALQWFIQHATNDIQTVRIHAYRSSIGHMIWSWDGVLMCGPYVQCWVIAIELVSFAVSFTIISSFVKVEFHGLSVVIIHWCTILMLAIILLMLKHLTITAKNITLKIGNFQNKSCVRVCTGSLWYGC